ncbi:hypothetical protein GQ54DRAFT_314316 [Martensiomyces pterosporus]|nr:hypothetical protein GQ54DRAFT_314316 [Martensiomyces pterosporus]
MSRQQPAHPAARVRCSQCPGSSDKYTASQLLSHQRNEHQELRKVSCGDNILVFTRGGREFPCACGGWYRCQSLKKHARSCATCMYMVHNASIGERIYMLPPPAAVPYQPAGPSAAHPRPMVSTSTAATGGVGALRAPLRASRFSSTPSTRASASSRPPAHSTPATAPLDDFPAGHCNESQTSGDYETC